MTHLKPIYGIMKSKMLNLLNQKKYLKEKSDKGGDYYLQFAIIMRSVDLPI